MSFRYDINGLRAIAVIAVVLFHFNPAWVPGGFVGVDVFFVISGFLMTGIIFRGLENNDFNLFKFYVARANRIIPALAVLCMTISILGWLFLSSADYMPLGKHVASSMGFLSNIIYMRESGYFDASSHEKWLLHTWSLSVEWQFYIIYPIILLALKKFCSLENIKRIIVIGAFLGFVLSVVATNKWPNPAYYLFPTRAWEMMIGGIAFLYPWDISENKKRFIKNIGFMLIVTSCFLISRKFSWPGYWALVPVMGAYLMIVANQQSSFITCNIVFQSIGRWSYSIYLWHWPIVVAGYLYGLSYPLIFGIILSVIIGFLSFKFVESIKFCDYFRWRDFVRVIPFYLVFFIGIVGSYVFLNSGLPSRLPEREQKKDLNAVIASRDWGYPRTSVKINGINLVVVDRKSDRNILLIGASHIKHLYPYFEGSQEDYNFYFLAHGGCSVPPLESDGNKSLCSDLYQYPALLSAIKFDKIITSFFTFDVQLVNKNIRSDNLELQGRIKSYDDFLAELKSYSNDVVLIKSEPSGDEFNPKLSVRKGLVNYIPKQEVRDRYRLHEYALSKMTETDNVRIIDPIEHLCLTDVCKTYDDEKGYFYMDDNHMRPWYVKEHASRYLDKIFN